MTRGTEICKDNGENVIKDGNLMESIEKSLVVQSLRVRDPYLDRRRGDDRRKIYSLVYFNQGNPDRRVNNERRKQGERRKNCFRVDTWSSVCPQE